MAARSRGVVRIMTRKSELEESGVWQTLGKKKKRLEPGKLKKKKRTGERAEMEGRSRSWRSHGHDLP